MIYLAIFSRTLFWLLVKSLKLRLLMIMFPSIYNAFFLAFEHISTQIFLIKIIILNNAKSNTFHRLNLPPLLSFVSLFTQQVIISMLALLVRRVHADCFTAFSFFQISFRVYAYQLSNVIITRSSAIFLIQFLRLCSSKKKNFTTNGNAKVVCKNPKKVLDL